MKHTTMVEPGTEIQRGTRNAECGSAGARAPGPREAYLAAHPEARELQAAQLAEITRRIGEVLDSWKPMARTFAVNAENARQAGLLLIDFEETLPGKRLTPDFYEQLKEGFRTADGSLLTLEFIHWLIHIAREFPDGIKTGQEVQAIWRAMPQVLQSEFGFELVAQEQRRHLAPAPTTQLKDFFKADIAEVIERIRSDRALCPDGRLRPELARALSIEMKPKLAKYDEAREWLKQQIGV